MFQADGTLRRSRYPACRKECLQQARARCSSKTLSTHTRGAKTVIKVTLPNGNIIKERTASETFVKTLEFFGIEAVRALSLTLNNAPLIDTKDSEKYTTFSSGRYFVMTHSNTQTKVGQLQFIAKKLGKSISINVV